MPPHEIGPSPLRRAMEILNDVPVVVGSTLMLVIGVAVFANVIARYVFSSGLSWADEVSRFSMLWVTFLGAAVLIRLGEHITVDVFMMRAPQRLRTASYVLSQLLSSYIAYILITQGIGQIGKQWTQLSPALQWNMGAVYIVLPFAGLYMLLYSLGNLAMLLTGRRLSHEISDKPLEL